MGRSMAATWCAEGATHACHRGWPQRGACRLANKPPPCGLASHRHSTFLTQTRAPERSGTSHAALCSTRAHRRIAVAAGGAGGIGGASSSGAHRGDPGWQRTPTPRSSDAPHRPGTSSPGRPVEGAHPSVPQRHSHPHPRATTQPTVAPFEESERDLQPGLQPSHPQIAPPAITGWQRRRDPLRWIEENDGDGDSGLLPAWRACRTQVLVHRQSLVGAQQSLALTHPGFQVYWIVIWQQEGAGGRATMHTACQPVDGQHSLAPSSPTGLSESLLHIEAGLHFTECDYAFGQWQSYFIALQGELSSADEEVQWPNQVVHGERRQHNLRSMDDLVSFLADAREEEVLAHVSRLHTIADERGYSKQWCWHMLRTRWGSQALKRLNLRRRDVLRGETPEGSQTA